TMDCFSLYYYKMLAYLFSTPPKIHFFLILVFTSIAVAENANDFFLKGIEAYNTENYEKALQEYEQARQLKPDSSEILTNLGLTHFKLNNKGLAIGFFRQVLINEGLHSTAREALSFAKAQ